jgi:hypothetical protein
VNATSIGAVAKGDVAVGPGAWILIVRVSWLKAGSINLIPWSVVTQIESLPERILVGLAPSAIVDSWRFVFGSGLYAGIDIDGPNKVIVGTADPGGGNLISFNAGPGIRVSALAHAQIRFNSIFANGLPENSVDSLGIDLNGNGVTANDPGDADTGPNNLQNFPVLTSVAANNSGTTIDGTLNSTPNTTFLVDFYSNVAGVDSIGRAYAACDTSGYGEGKTYLGTVSVTTNGSGDTSFSQTVSTVLATGAVVTATATDPDGNTSEFSACRAAEGSPNGAIIVRKVTDPSSDTTTTFAFTTGGGLSPATFSLTNGQSQTFSTVAAGSGYSFAESATTGWDLTSARCDDGSPVSNIDVSAAPSGTQLFTFQLRQGASTSSAGTILESTNATAGNGGSSPSRRPSSPARPTRSAKRSCRAG